MTHSRLARAKSSRTPESKVYSVPLARVARINGAKGCYRQELLDQRHQETNWGGGWRGRTTQQHFVQRDERIKVVRGIEGC